MNRNMNQNHDFEQKFSIFIWWVAADGAFLVRERKVFLNYQGILRKMSSTEVNLNEVPPATLRKSLYITDNFLETSKEFKKSNFQYKKYLYLLLLNKSSATHELPATNSLSSRRSRAIQWVRRHNLLLSSVSVNHLRDFRRHGNSTLQIGRIHFESLVVYYD